MIQNIGKILSRYWYVFVVKGVGYTLLLSTVVLVFGAILGSIMAVGKGSKIAPLRWLITAIVEVVRGTPSLLHLYVGYFFVPKILNINGLSAQKQAFFCCAVALIVNSAAYVSEIVRSGIEAVDKGQTEASRSLGVNGFSTMTKVILPQAIKNILPALGNEFITVIKETSLASTFFVGDLMTAFLEVRGITYLPVECLIIVAVIYFIITFTLSKCLGVFERKMKKNA
ncbi:MAG: amino acid ABC transporter permease [Clostridia bacterium]|nr:amino acid ABC transporter permease [Clostridia bacterium]